MSSCNISGISFDRIIHNDEIIELSEQNEANTDKENESVKRESSTEDEIVDQTRIENNVNNSSTIEADNNGDHEEEVDAIAQVAQDESHPQGCPHHHSSAYVNMNRELGVNRSERCVSTSREGTSFDVTTTPTQESATNVLGNHTVVPLAAVNLLPSLVESHQSDLCMCTHNGSSANNHEVNVTPVLETGSGEESSDTPNDHTEHNTDESQFPDNDVGLR